MNMQNTQLSDEIICPCSGTTKAKVQSLIAQGFDLEAISRKTGAISGCGGCEWDIADLIKDHTQNSCKNT